MPNITHAAAGPDHVLYFLPEGQRLAYRLHALTIHQRGEPLDVTSRCAVEAPLFVLSYDGTAECADIGMSRLVGRSGLLGGAMCQRGDAVAPGDGRGPVTGVTLHWRLPIRIGDVQAQAGLWRDAGRITFHWRSSGDPDSSQSSLALPALADDETLRGLMGEPLPPRYETYVRNAIRRSYTEQTVRALLPPPPGPRRRRALVVQFEGFSS
jgi:hypothetical protein